MANPWDKGDDVNAAAAAATGGDGPWAKYAKSDVKRAPVKGQPAAASGEGEPAAAGGDAPKMAEAESVVPAAIDSYKRGVAGTLALPNLAVDAVQFGLDSVKNIGDISRKSAEAVGLIKPRDPAEAAAKQWSLGNPQDKENRFGYKEASKAWSGLLRFDKALEGHPEQMTQDVETPKDAFGGTSKANERIVRIANYLGASVIPGAASIPSAARPLLTAAVSVLADASSGITSVELGDQMANLAPKFGMTREQGKALGDQWGGFFGPKMVSMAGQAIAKSTSEALKLAPKNLPWTAAGKEAQKADAAVRVNQEVRRAVDSNPTNAENLAELTRLQERMTNFKPGIAAATNDPSLVALTKQVSQKSPQALLEAGVMDARNKKAIADYKEEKFPNERPVPLNQGARAAANVDKGMVAQQLDNVQRQMTAMADKFTRSADKTAIGEDLREMYFNRKELVKKALDVQMDDVYQQADQYKIRVGMTDVRDTVKAVMGSDKEAFQNMPEIFRKVDQRFATPPTVQPKPVQSAGSSSLIRRAAPVPQAPPDTSVSFKELHSLYKEANRTQNDYLMAGNVDMARKVGILKDVLNKKVEAFSAPEYGKVGEKLRDFNVNYTKYAQTFKEGSGGMLGKRGPQGYSTDAENIVDKVFLRSGDKQKGLDDFYKVYGNDEHAAGLLKDGITDNFSRAAVDRNGNFNAAGAATWLKRNARAMDQMPQLRDELTKQTDTAGMLVVRQKELLAQRGVLDKYVVGQAAREQRPELLIAEGMRNPSMFKALLKTSVTKDSRESLARGIADYVTQGQKDPLAFVLQNKNSLKPVMDSLGKDHWQNLEDIARAKQIADRTPLPTSVTMTKPQDFAEKTVGTSGRSLISVFRNNAAGHGSNIDSAVFIGGRLIYKVRADQMDKLMQQSLFDPDVAAVLAKITKEDKPTERNLLDLKRIAFDKGIGIAVTSLGVQNKRDEDRKAGKTTPVEQSRTEGDGKWRRRTDSWMH